MMTYFIAARSAVLLYFRRSTILWRVARLTSSVGLLLFVSSSPFRQTAFSRCSGSFEFILAKNL